MITGLKFIGVHDVKLGSTGKFKLAGTEKVLSIKEIPAIRYRLSAYEEREIDFIMDMKKTFPNSVHAVECSVEQSFDAVKALSEKDNTFVFIVHISLNDTHAMNKSFSDEELDMIQSLKDLPIDRIMFDDNSTTLDYIAFSTLTTIVRKATGMRPTDIGICGSPFTDAETCCMSAALAREWSAKYVTNPCEALPSGNHNNEGRCCGCFRYETINCDIVPVEGEAKVMNEPESDEDVKEHKEKKQSTPKPKYAPEWKGSLLGRRIVNK